LSGAKDLIHAFKHLSQLFRRRAAEALPNALGRQRPDLADLDPGRFDSAGVTNSSVNGNPARCGWLVRATAITVPDRSLNMS